MNNTIVMRTNVGRVGGINDGSSEVVHAFISPGSALLPNAQNLTVRMPKRR